jgi:hypothetical protein
LLLTIQPRKQTVNNAKELGNQISRLFVCEVVEWRYLLKRAKNNCLVFLLFHLSFMNFQPFLAQREKLSPEKNSLVLNTKIGKSKLRN